MTLLKVILGDENRVWGRIWIKDCLGKDRPEKNRKSNALQVYASHCQGSPPVRRMRSLAGGYSLEWRNDVSRLEM